MTRPFFNQFAPYLTQRSKMRVQIRFYQQNWYPTKSKMAAAAIFKFRFLATTGPLRQYWTYSHQIRHRDW